MGSQLIRYESPAIDAPLLRDANEIASIFFSSANITRSGQFVVISENDVNYIILQELKNFADENGNGVYDVGEEIFLNYKLMIFISKDVSYLQKAFEKTRPAPGDVCIYLEDNSTDTFSGTTAWKMEGMTNIVVGIKVRDQLDSWLSENNNAGFDAFKELETQFNFSIDLSRDEMRTLIAEGELQNASRMTALTLFQALNSFQTLTASLYSGIGNLLLSATATLRSYITFQDYHWDPGFEASGESSRSDETKEFNPVLVSAISAVIESAASYEQSIVDTVINHLEQELSNWHNNVTGRINAFANLRSTKLIVPTELLAFANKTAGLINDLLKKLLSSCKQIVPWLAYLGEKWLNTVNAFYCGLWNSLVEAVLGIVDLVGYIFVATGAAANLAANMHEIVPQALEVIDEMIQNFSKINFSNIISESFSEIVTQIKTIDLGAMASEISIERIGYFVGGFIGFVVQMAIGIYCEAGIGGIQAALQKMGTIGSNLIKFMQLEIREAIGIAVAYSIEGLIAIINKIKDTLLAGAEEVVKMIRYIFEAFRKGFQTMEDFIAAIKSIFSLTSDDISLVKKLGGEFTSLFGKTCTICD